MAVVAGSDFMWAAISLGGLAAELDRATDSEGYDEIEQFIGWSEITIAEYLRVAGLPDNGEILERLGALHADAVTVGGKAGTSYTDCAIKLIKQRLYIILDVASGNMLPGTDFITWPPNGPNARLRKLPRANLIHKPNGDRVEVIDIWPEMRSRLRELPPFDADRLRISIEKEWTQLEAIAPLRTPKTILPNETRDAWLYDQFTRIEDGGLVPQKTIVTRLCDECEKHNWSLTKDIPSLKLAANRWAERHRKDPIPKRQSGRKKLGA